MSDHIAVRRFVGYLNAEVVPGTGINYQYNHSSGMHTLELSHNPDALIKTKDDTRAMNFVLWYSAGVYAGQVAERTNRSEQSETTLRSDQSVLRRALNKLFGKA